MNQPPQRQPADPGARRRAVLWLLLGTAAGLLLLFLVDAVTRQIDEPAQALRWLYLLIGLLALASLLMLWPLSRLWRIGRDARRAQRFPPPGLALTRATTVLHGAAAERRGRLLQWFAAGVALTVLLIPLWLAWMTLTVFRGHAGG